MSVFGIIAIFIGLALLSLISMALVIYIIARIILFFFKSTETIIGE